MSSILVISPEPWDGHFVSKHHYAIELASRGHDVLFFGPPETAGRMWLERVSWGDLTIRVIHAPRVVPGLRYLPETIRRALEGGWLRNLERLAGGRIDVIWLFENSRFFDMSFAGERVKIYHQVDLNQDFHPRIAAETADLTIAVSRPIAEFLGCSARQLIRVNHGCHVGKGPPSQPEDLAARFSDWRVNAMMTGNLDIPYLDVALVSDLVCENPDVRFHFVGRYTPQTGLHAAVGQARNVIFWGRQPAECLPPLLQHADVLMVIYNSEEHLLQLANPHKIMEYLGSGRVVLATRTLEYEERPGLIEVAQDRDAYRALFRSITVDPGSWNTAAKIARRRAFAMDNTYARQLDRIADALGARRHLIS